MCERILSSLLAIALLAAPIAASAQSGTTISGRIIDVDGGLPVENATIELDQAGTKVATTATDAAGTFHFPGQAPGTYSILITATGYGPTRMPDVGIEAGQPEVRLQTAIRRSAALKTIGRVSVAARNSLQTSSTINQYFDATLLENEGFQRIGDALGTIPGVITSTSSSIGDDETLSIRGYDTTETATLLDNHPIGPIGAQGGGFNYSISPFWGVSGADVIFGSGATGLYGATTIAGAVNFITLSPTRDPRASFTQGVGTDSHLLSGLTVTGTDGKLGYALASAVQGTNGMFDPQYRLQRGLLTASAANSGLNGGSPPPDLTAANQQNPGNFYVVSGAYNQRNDMLKFDWDFSPRTSFEATGYIATAWQNKTGEGDNDYTPYQYQLFNGRNIISGLTNNKDTSQLPNGSTGTCTGSILVLVDTPSQYTCMNANQYASAFTGPFGGGPDRWKGLIDQDYHARFTQMLGVGQLLIDGYTDNYSINEQKAPSGPQYFDTYRTGGFVVTDDFAFSKNDFSFGFNTLHQTHDTFTDSVAPVPGSFDLGTISYFVKDAWTPSLKVSAFANLWLQHSTATGATKLNPRLAIVYRPDSSDVIRIAGGSAYSEPDPALLVGPTSFGAPTSLNPVCGKGDLNSIGSTSNPSLLPETGSDLDLSYGHRFNRTTSFQADVYQSYETGALLNGNLVITPAQAALAPAGAIDAFLERIHSQCGPSATVANLGLSTTYNAASGRYRGFNLQGQVGVMRNLLFTASFAVTSASYLGIPKDILMQNPTLLDGGQIYGIPLRQGTTSLEYQSPGGFGIRMDGNYVGSPNSFNRGPYWYADGSISQQVGINSTVNLGVNNMFNSIAQNYGLIGLGSFQPENQFGTDTNAFEQGSERYGLPFKQFWLTVTTRI